MTAFLLFHFWMGGLHRVHFYYVGFGLVLLLFHEKTRMFLILALPVFLHNILYDMFRYVPFQWFLPIRIQEPYLWDQWLFGITQGDQVILFHQYLQQFSHTALDILSGLLYHIHGAVVFILVFLLWRLKSKNLAFRFAVAFLFMNLMSFATYLLFPAAAPWYVEAFGFAQPGGPVIGSAAGLAKFDQLFSLHFSENMYSLNPVVFGAVPSMHAGFTMLCWLFARKINKYWSLLFAAYTLAMCYSAMYLGHHYLIDVVWGITYALVAYVFIEKWQSSRVDQGFSYLENFC